MNKPYCQITQLDLFAKRGSKPTNPIPPFSNRFRHQHVQAARTKKTREKKKKKKERKPENCAVSSAYFHLPRSLDFTPPSLSSFSLSPRVLYFPSYNPKKKKYIYIYRFAANTVNRTSNRMDKIVPKVSLSQTDFFPILIFFERLSVIERCNFFPPSD